MFALFLCLVAFLSLFKNQWMQLLLSFEVLSLLLWFMSKLWEQNLRAKDIVACKRVVGLVAVGRTRRTYYSVCSQ